MAESIKYSRMFVAVNGANSLEATNISLTFNSNAQKVKTIGKGLAGTTDGAGEVSFSLDFMVPLNGFEKNWTDVLAVNEVVSLEFMAAGLRLPLDKATVESAQMGYQTDGIMTLSISGFAAYDKFQ